MTDSPRAGSSLEQWLEYQQSTHSQTIDLSLERVREVAARLGLLEPRCAVAIVGGTNGKGSTATALAGMLCACGWRTGLFTSPHLVSYNERVRIDGTEAADQELVGAFERIEAARGAITLTYFEYNTLAALQVFERSAVDAMVLEVGLGGRLDATNILDADVAVLCSVGLDHRDWLGDTVEQIGAEKAGIFRRDQPVVLGSADMPDSVWRRLADLQCRVHCPQREFDWRIDGGEGFAGEPWQYRSARCTLAGLPAPALPGAIQYRNAATALTALQLLAAPGACEHGRIAPALRSLALPGRLQIVPGPVEWILDVAHNEPAAQVLAGALAARPVSGRTLAVVSLLADKDAAAVGRRLDALIDHWILTGVQDEPRGLSAQALAARLPPLRGTLELADTVPVACGRAHAQAAAGDRVVVLGSFHVVRPALMWLGLY
ncbi:MAG TPA: bifunctional tetrahydrofolate synthase/dihydrofolate synthase [Steroidobacteraceae bacterium]|nr:bifunctional tetrahydrofolate synthase/dihydrofolate synthase [Steroidobacteraceae bacterium]